MESLKNTKYGKSYIEEIRRVEKEKAYEILAEAEKRYQLLIKENDELADKIKVHTEKMIFPAIATYQAILETDPERAMEIMETAESRVSMKTGESYRKILKLSFMRKPFLRIFSEGAKSGFSDESGFINQFIRDEKNDIYFQIKKCPYHDYCEKYGCPELTHIFCNNDINAYGKLPGINFERHETLGNGGNLCDFHLCLKDK